MRRILKRLFGRNTTDSEPNEFDYLEEEPETRRRPWEYSSSSSRMNSNQASINTSIFATGMDSGGTTSGSTDSGSSGGGCDSGGGADGGC